MQLIFKNMYLIENVYNVVFEKKKFCRTTFFEKVYQGNLILIKINRYVTIIFYGISNSGSI